ncbi:MAG: hypothetical protein JF616_09910 [Fibrobacteres bacterium]|nr:hypothetical protein [Fibrobacterota bacterium]
MEKRSARLWAWAAALAALAALAAGLEGCASSRLPPQSQTAAADIAAPGLAQGPADSSLRYQIIYVIHGDGGYVWYDDAGARHEADREALAQARETAENASAAEVFIFHQRPTRFLRIFPGSDGTLWQYRKGRLVRRLPYSRNREYDPAARPEDPSRGEDDLAAEAGLFARFSALPAPRRCGAPAAAGPVRVFCYFGHGIPVTGKVPYFRSRPDVAFSLAGFSRGLVRFGGPACPPAKPFALVVLSACHGGTPEATMAVAPFADWILASPGELHLSYLDTRALARASQENPVPSQENPVSFEAGQGGAWGRTIAMESFARLEASVRTGVTISLYETGKAETYLKEHRVAWGGPALFAEPTEYRDCGENTEFGAGGEAAGAMVFYQPPRFGIDRNKSGHSGWECPVSEPRRAEAP